MDVLKHAHTDNKSTSISGLKLSEKNTMRQIFSLIAAIALAASVATASASSASARPSPWQHSAIQCSMPGGPCASGSDAAYNHCTDLALQRGETLNGGRGSLDFFVYQCLAGHIPE
jgi:hypothetical protein